jgi:hypothetical protein
LILAFSALSFQPRLLLDERPASGAVRVEVDGDDDSLKTYSMPAGGATSATG